METFSALLALYVGIHRPRVNSPHKGQRRGALVFSLICTWINGCVNNHEVGDLRRHCAHYDVIVMLSTDVPQASFLGSLLFLKNMNDITNCIVYSNFILYAKTLRWRHNHHDSVSNHQPHGCLLNRLFRRRSKKTSKLRVTGLCVGNSPGPVNSPHKGPVTRKMVPFDDVIMKKRFPHYWLGALVRSLMLAYTSC